MYIGDDEGMWEIGENGQLTSHRACFAGCAEYYCSDADAIGRCMGSV